jgi:Rrf2 family protein
MKFSSQEEYGLRCLLRLGRDAQDRSLTIPEISEAEGISEPNVAKLMRILRRGGFVTSARGQAGGYQLARPPERINIGEAMAVLGGRLFDPGFCERHAGMGEICTNSSDCSVRSLWHTIQVVVDNVLSKTTLRDLMGTEQQATAMVEKLVEISAGLPPVHQMQR